MGKVRGARNLAENLQKSMIRGHQSGTKQRQLSEQFRVAPATVSEILKKNRLSRGIPTQYAAGRPRSDLVHRKIFRASRINPQLSAIETFNVLSQGPGFTVSPWTVRRRLRADGQDTCRSAQKPLEERKIRALRLMWTKGHVNWTPDQGKKFA